MSARADNRLAGETSPYLLQHQDNPVAWRPWGTEALAEAKDNNKPILLSVGYAACHWCHVMAHESFEDAATAAVMNELFVNIKVDREERPDIDQIYMSALHHLGEQGGWPLTMFLTPNAEPFWGGTYFPKESRYGRPAFTDVLREVARLFREEPDKIAQNRDALMQRLQAKAMLSQRVVIGAKELNAMALRLGSAFDHTHGGLQGAPKFPQATMIEFLWRAGMAEASSSWPGIAGRSTASLRSPMTRPSIETKEDGSPGHAAMRRPGDDEDSAVTNSNRFLDLVILTLRRISEGGIYDHLGGGFSRYSVDERWLVPHFEKMLYDNAQLMELLALAYQHSGDAMFAARMRETVGWLVREMTGEGGAFSSSLDADSEGEEGKFYVWSRSEIIRVLGEADGAYFAHHYDVTEDGNFEGHTILNRLGQFRPAQRPHPNPPPQAGEGREGVKDETRLRAMREKLLAVREGRIRPGLDDKVLADWNGLMIAALVNAGNVLNEPDWITRARRAFDFIANEMTRENGRRLGHSWRAGKLLYPGLASDYAAMIRAALALHEASGEGALLERARVWQDALDAHYSNDANGGYYLTADDASGLVIRPASTLDDAVPNPNALAAQNLIRLAALTGDERFRAKADALIAGVLSAGGDNLFGHVGLLNAIDMRLRMAEIVVTGGDDALLETARAIPFLQRTILRAPDAAALPANHPAREKIATSKGAAAAFVCMGERCSLPVTTADALMDTMREMRS